MNDLHQSYQPYVSLHLEPHTNWVGMTGVSLPIGTNALDNPLETPNLMDGEQ